MKMTRKIIPALAMLLVSAIMLTTASFAWLANSTEVSVGDMTVKANTDVVFLQISNNGTSWGRSATATTATNEDLDLVNATVADNVISWRTAEGANPDSYGKAGEYTSVPTASVSGTYALVNTFYVKVREGSSNLYDLKINEVTLGAAIADEDAFDNALRLLVVATDDEDAVIGYQCYDIGTDALSAAGGFTANDILAEEVTTDVITLTVYIYYDGEDTVAFTDNLDSVTTKAISVSFTASETNS